MKEDHRTRRLVQWSAESKHRLVPMRVWGRVWIHIDSPSAVSNSIGGRFLCKVIGASRRSMLVR